MGAKGKVFVISGPSGAGKGTLVAEILKQIPKLKLSVSDTTRHLRPGDIPSKSYCFLTEEEFKEKIRRGEFLEWAVVHGHYYGTPLSFVLDNVKTGHSVALEIDVQGALQVKKKIPDSVMIFIAVPSLKVLEERLIARKTESKEELAIRMHDAEQEMQQAGEFDHLVVNDVLKQAADELVEIIKKETGTV